MTINPAVAVPIIGLGVVCIVFVIYIYLKWRDKK